MATDYDRTVRNALESMTAETVEAWRQGYAPDEAAERAARDLLGRTEAEMRAAGTETTIRTVWMRLADKAGREGTPGAKAASALAGMALGLSGA